MMARVLAILGVLLALGVPGDAEAARKKQKPKSDAVKSQPMRFTIVRHAQAGCEPWCAEWIAAEGDIVQGSAAELRRILKAVGKRRLPVFVHSRGGSIEDALAIGKLIREKGLDVAVARTELEPCRKGVKKCKDGRAPAGSVGRPVSFQAYCASACALVLGSGARRLVSHWSGVGVHQVQTLQTTVRVHRTYNVETRTDSRGRVKRTKKLVSEKRIGSSTRVRKTKDSTYGQIEALMVAGGVDASIMPIMRATPHEGMHWLTVEEQRSTRMTTHFAGAALLVAEAEAKAAAASVGSGEAGPAGSGAFRASETLRLGPYLRNEAEAQVSLTHDGADGRVGIEIRLSENGSRLETQPMLARVAIAGRPPIEALSRTEDAPFGALVASLPAEWLCNAGEGSLTLEITIDIKGSNDPATAMPTQLHPRQIEGGDGLISRLCPARQQSAGQ